MDAAGRGGENHGPFGGKNFSIPDGHWRYGPRPGCQPGQSRALSCAVMACPTGRIRPKSAIARVDLVLVFSRQGFGQRVDGAFELGQVVVDGGLQD